jgi:ketosteroid isomerase-like protein
MREQWARNLHDKLIDASMAEYTADGEFVDPGGNRVRGTTALHKLFETVTAMYDSDLTFDSQRVEVSADLAYDSGTYRETLIVRATAKTQHSSGSYPTIYRRGKNGAWLIAEQEWTGAIGDEPVVAYYRDGIKSSARAICKAARAGMQSQVSIDSLGLGI